MDPTPQQAASRSGSPSHEQASASSEHLPRRNSVPQSTTSEDSQTVLLNHPANGISPKPSPSPESQSEKPSKPKRAPSSLEPKKCWICLQTESEDTPESTRWRKPCKCHLQAHEACLLDWVAEVEKSKSKVECPQCKTPIKIIRPRSLVLAGVRSLHRISSKLILPASAIILLSGVTVACYEHGKYTIVAVCGRNDAQTILRDLADRGLEFLLPLVPVSLLISRVNYSDNLLPFLPIVYFSVYEPYRKAPLWPPSLMMTLTALPYLRAGYNHAYKYLFAQRESAWIKEVQPRHGEGAEGGDNQDGGLMMNAGGGGNGEMNFELGIQVEVEEEVEDGPDEAAQPEQPPQNEGNGQNEQQGEGQPGAQPAAAPPAQNENQNQGRAANAINAVPIIINVILEKAIGAIIFPWVSSSVGMILKHTLPEKWVMPPPYRYWRAVDYPAGFLQSQFGRSVAGGCLFVVLKDSLLLYAKYKNAQVHRQRKIANYRAKKDKP